MIIGFISRRNGGRKAASHEFFVTAMAEDVIRGGGRALWAQIADAVQSEIAGGVYRPGAALPTEAALADRFGVNRHTVRRAVRHLVDGGLVKVEQGRGSFVSENVLDYVLGRRTRFSASLSAADNAASRELLFAERIRAEARIAEHLGLRAGAPLWRLELLGKSGERPISIGSHYFSARRFPDLPEAFARCGTISRTLAALGVPDYTRRWTRITAVLPEAGDAERLGQPRTRPVLRTDALNVDPAGAPVEFGRARFAADRVQLLVGEDT
jgi:GntR family transcriptional regulator, phosphonate transport system regulatory protein